MIRYTIAEKWQTKQLRVSDSIHAEVEALQQINDAVPQTQSWMQVPGQENTAGSMLLALQEGVLPPTPDRSKEYFRLQSIHLARSGKLIGFIGVYHGFPECDIFWINTVTLHPKYQGKGYGTELLEGLVENVKQLKSYTRMRTFVSLTNWPSLRLCIKAGLNRMVEIAGDKVHSEVAEAHVLVERSFLEA